MIKKINAVFFAALMLVSIFSACSGKGTDSDDDAAEICGTWQKQGDDANECVYVINADGTGYIEENSVKYELTWEIDENNNYTFYIDATNTTESGIYTVNSAFLVLIHDDTHDYFRRVEE